MNQSCYYRFPHRQVKSYLSSLYIAAHLPIPFYIATLEYFLIDLHVELQIQYVVFLTWPQMMVIVWLFLFPLQCISKYDYIGEKDQEGELGSSNIIVEQIDGTCYTFDSADCAMMFKKFSAVYGSNFADE